MCPRPEWGYEPNVGLSCFDDVCFLFYQNARTNINRSKMPAGAMVMHHKIPFPERNGNGRVCYMNVPVCVRVCMHSEENVAKIAILICPEGGVREDLEEK